MQVVDLMNSKGKGEEPSRSPSKNDTGASSLPSKVMMMDLPRL